MKLKLTFEQNGVTGFCIDLIIFLFVFNISASGKCQVNSCLISVLSVKCAALLTHVSTLESTSLLLEEELVILFRQPA